MKNPQEILSVVAGLSPTDAALEKSDWADCYPVVSAAGVIEGIIDADGTYTDRTGYTIERQAYNIINDTYAVLVDGEAAAVAARIRGTDEWELSDCAALCEMAGMGAEWEDADGDNFEAVVFAAASKLGVEVV